MSLTMCGCFQLTSEACYKYSDAAHCAHRCSPEKNKQMQSRVPTQLGYTVPSHNTSNASGGLHYGTSADSVSSSPNYNLCYCYRDFFSDVSHIFFREQGPLCWEAPLTDWMTDPQRDNRTDSAMSTRQHLHGDCSVSSTQGFFFSFNFSRTVNPKKKRKIELESCVTWPSKLSLHIRLLFGAERA